MAEAQHGAESKMNVWITYFKDRFMVYFNDVGTITPNVAAALVDIPPWALGLTIFIIAISLLWILFKIIRRIRKEASEPVRAVKEFLVPTEGPRFRKRDKIEFMGRRVFRNAKAVGSLIRGK